MATARQAAEAARAREGKDGGECPCPVCGGTMRWDFRRQGGLDIALSVRCRTRGCVAFD